MLPARPRLAPKARIRHDRVTEREVLLAPEHALFLSPSAAEVLALCEGRRSIEQIVCVLRARHREVEPAALRRDVEELLAALATRGFVEDAG